MLLFGDFILGLLSLADQFSRIKTESLELLNLIEKSVSKVFPYEKSNSSNDFFLQPNKNSRSANVNSIRIFIFSVIFVKIAYNVSGLCDGGAIEAQIFNFAQKLNRRNNVEPCSFPPLLQNPC